MNATGEWPARPSETNAGPRDRGRGLLGAASTAGPKVKNAGWQPALLLQNGNGGAENRVGLKARPYDGELDGGELTSSLRSV